MPVQLSSPSLANNVARTLYSPARRRNEQRRWRGRSEYANIRDMRIGSTMVPQMNRTRALTRGAGSLLDIAPTVSLDRFPAHESAQERVASCFRRVGDALRHAMAEEGAETPAHEPAQAKAPRQETG